MESFLENLFAIVFQFGFWGIAIYMFYLAFQKTGSKDANNTNKNKIYDKPVKSVDDTLNFDEMLKSIMQNLEEKKSIKVVENTGLKMREEPYSGELKVQEKPAKKGINYDEELAENKARKQKNQKTANQIENLSKDFDKNYAKALKEKPVRETKKTKEEIRDANNISPYLKILQEPDSLRKAFIMSEIFKTKF